MSNKQKIKVFILVKNFYAKDIINKVKNLKICEEIFVSHISNKDLLSVIYKELLAVKDKKTNQPTKKWRKDLNKYFSEEDISGNKNKNVQRHQ